MVRTQAPCFLSAASRGYKSELVEPGLVPLTNSALTETQVSSSFSESGCLTVGPHFRSIVVPCIHLGVVAFVCYICRCYLSTWQIKKERREPRGFQYRCACVCQCFCFLIDGILPSVYTWPQGHFQSKRGIKKLQTFGSPV